MMKIKINDVRYFVEVHQEIKTLPNVIFLHGFMGSGRVFSPVIPHCSVFCNPITIDLLGHGKTEKGIAPDRFSADHQIADLNKIIKQIADRPPFLHGYSMGGRLAIRYALAYPHKLRGLILESTNYGLNDPKKMEERLCKDEKRAETIENDFESFLDNWKTLPLFQHRSDLAKEKMNFYEQIQHRQHAEQMAKSLRGFGTARMPSVKDQLPDLQLPVLFIAGQTDIKYTTLARFMHASTPNSSLSIISDTGHRVHLEQSKSFISSIQSFINKVDLK